MATEEWRNKRDSYYGSGESFLFTFKNDRFVKYIWTRNNSYFQLSNFDGLAMGGGHHFGLFIDGDLHRGSSDHCETFGSATLSGHKTFDVVNVEVWGFSAPNVYETSVDIDRLTPPRYGGGGYARSRRTPTRGLAESLCMSNDYDVPATVDR